jgi:Spy/CpxP family protein refolding chaperone
MKTAIAASALGAAMLLPTASALAQQSGPPRDPNPPSYDERYDSGCYQHRHGHDGPTYGYRHGHRDGYHDNHGNWHTGYYDQDGQWHEGYYDNQGKWHEGGSS